jgi:hypothetical protein
MSVATPSATASARPRYQTLEVGPGEEAAFRENYNVRPFLLNHRLAQHPLLQLEHLTKVAQAYAEQHPERFYHDEGRAEVGRGWDYATKRAFSAQEAIRQIETAEAWMILKGVQILPEYGELLNTILSEIHEISSRDLARKTRTRNISLIITSPRRVTPYHMDADCNYLLQLSGAKTVYVFNGADRSVVTAEELEAFYRSDVNAARFKQETQAGAWKFELTPGRGVHVPVTFPHWVQNGDSVSISASINFCFVDHTVPDLYRVNYYLRRAGLKPSPPGASAMSDGVKKLAASTLRMVARRNQKGDE